MNWPKRAFTNTQQAPALVQSARVVPVKVASSSIHSITGTKARQSRNATTSVIDGVERRREQVFADGFPARDERHRVTSAILALYQFISAETQSPIAR